MIAITPNAVTNGGPYRNHGKLVSTAAKTTDAALAAMQSGREPPIPRGARQWQAGKVAVYRLA